MSLLRLSIRGVAFNWLGRFCRLAIAFVLTPILIHELGNEDYGVWSIVVTFTTYYAMADLGLSGATIKYLSQHDAENDHDAANRVFVTAFCLYCLLVLFVLLIVCGMVILYPVLFEATSLDSATLRWVVMLSGLGASVVILGQVFDATLAAAKRFDQKNMIAIAAQTVQAILFVIALRSGGSLFEMACIVLFVTIGAQLMTMVLALRSIPYLTLSSRYFDRETAGTLFRYGSLFLIQGFGLRASRSAGVIIVGAIQGPAAVTFFAIAESLANKSSELGKGIGSVLMPLASQLEAQERSADLVRALLLATRALVALSVSLATIFIAFGWPLVEYWIGERYAPTTYPVLFVLSFAVVLRMSSMASRSVLRGTGKMRFLATVGMIEVAITVGLGVVLTNQLGLIGMAVAIVCAQLPTSATVIPLYACRSLQVSLGTFLFSGAGLGLLVALPGGVLASLMHYVVPPTNLGLVVLCGFIVGVTVCATLFFVGIGRDTRADILRSLVPASLLRARKRSGK